MNGDATHGLGEGTDSDFVWGVLAIIPGFIVGKAVGGFVVALLFAAIASFNPPGWSLYVIIPVLLAVFAGIILSFCIAFMRLYYRLGLPQNIRITG